MSSIVFDVGRCGSMCECGSISGILQISAYRLSASVSLCMIPSFSRSIRIVSMTYNGAEEITNADAPFLPAASIGQPIPLLSIVLNVQTDQDLPGDARFRRGHWHI